MNKTLILFLVLFSTILGTGVLATVVAVGYLNDAVSLVKHHAGSLR